jgi:hypothetical protein
VKTTEINLEGDKVLRVGHNVGTVFNIKQEMGIAGSDKRI